MPHRKINRRFQISLFIGVTLITMVISAMASWLFRENFYKILVEQTAKDNQVLGEAILSLIDKTHKEKTLDSLIPKLQSSCDLLKLPNGGFVCATNSDGLLVAAPIAKNLGIGESTLTKAKFNSLNRDKTNTFNDLLNDSLFVGYYEYPTSGYSDIVVKIKHQSGLHILVHQDNKKIMEKANAEGNKLLFGGLLFSLIIGLVTYLFVNNQAVLYQKTIIKQNEKIKETHKIVEKQRDNLVSSINYALRIQNAIIPKEQEIQKYFPESFVLFRPKDIVSGDFYWFADKITDTGNKKIIVVADCTGHGVSGAFMTMIGNNMLNHIVHDQEITQPNEILNQMTPLLEKTLLHSEGKVKDGMDISIVSIETRNTISQRNDISNITYAGAMNSLYYIENQEFKEIKADKVPIGGKQKEGFSYQLSQLSMNSKQLSVNSKQLDDNTLITDNSLLITDNCLLYLCTDGFQDQFGGTEKRKFMVSKFKKLLLEISEKPMAVQKLILETTISNWISGGNETQTDDICVLGIRL